MPYEVMMHDRFWRAADRLRKIGWCQNQFRSHSGKEDLVQSILSQFGLIGKDSVLDHRYLTTLDGVLAANYYEYEHDLVVAYERAPQGATDDEVVEQAIIAWNNRAGRTAEEVIMVLRLAGDRAWDKWMSYHSRLLGTEAPIEPVWHFAGKRTLIAA